MTNSFRIDATEVRAWRAALGTRMELRGVPAIAKEMEAHLAQKSDDGTVVITRHQLFTWAEALHGVAARDTTNGLAPIIADMRGILAGKVEPPTRTMGLPSPTPPPRTGPTVGFGGFPTPGQEIQVTEPGRSPYTPAPPVVYNSALAGATQASGARVLTGPALADAVRDTIRAATRDLYVSSPWATGVETLVPEITALAPAIRVLLLSRRPERDDAAFHQAMDSLGRRRAITVWSPHIQTRMIIADDARAIVGAASAPGPASREVGVLITDAATIAALRAHFERAHLEAAGGKIP